MNRSIAGGVFFVASMAFAATASAVSVTVGGTPSASAGDFSSVSGVTTVDFDAAAPAGWSISGDHRIVSGSSFGLYAAPQNGGNPNSSKYLSVPHDRSSGTAVITLGSHYDYYGLYWGSIDDYNTLSFWNGDTQVFSFTGTEASDLLHTQANGNQSLAAYFNFFGLPQFNVVKISSSSYAFETDNHAFGHVPVPATAALLALGCLALVGMRRRELQPRVG